MADIGWTCRHTENSDGIAKVTSAGGLLSKLRTNLEGKTA